MFDKIITSPSNPLVRKAVEARTGRHPAGEGIFLAEGPHILEMAAKASARLKEVFVTGEFAETDEGKRLLKQLSILQAPAKMIIRVTAGILSRICDTSSPQGIAALVSFAKADLNTLRLGDVPLIAACDGIQDPGNLGTIIRVSDAIGADAVIILPESCDPLSPKVVRSTAGSIFNIPVVAAGHGEFSDYLESKGIDLVVTDIRARKTIYETDLRRPVALVFGNEARGVSRQLQHRAADFVRLPMPGKAESLNAAVAAAVCMYEAVRQRL